MESNEEKEGQQREVFMVVEESGEARGARLARSGGR